MSNILKTILVLVFFALGAFAFSTGEKVNFRAPDAAILAANEVAPKDLYVSNCARCHGADGAGETDLGRKLDVPDLTISGSRMSIKKITRIITAGKEEMPGFGQKLSKKQIANLSAYVRKL